MSETDKPHFADPYEAAECGNQVLLAIAALLIVLGLPILESSAAKADPAVILHARIAAHGGAEPHVW